MTRGSVSLCVCMDEGVHTCICVCVCVCRVSVLNVSVNDLQEKLHKCSLKKTYIYFRVFDFNFGLL